jgi:5-methylcytosine-specific restriction endonuclease McrA
VADRRYRTRRWQRFRLMILARDRGLCQGRGPNCTVVATTAHHKLPSSQHPELFWDPSNVEASCGPCNHHGAVVKRENRINRQTIAHLERENEQLGAQVEELLAQLSGLRQRRAGRGGAATADAEDLLAA